MSKMKLKVAWQGKNSRNISNTMWLCGGWSALPRDMYLESFQLLVVSGHTVELCILLFWPIREVIPIHLWD